MRETTFQLRDQPFAALTWGEPGGLPTVLVHGFLDHAGAWERVAPGLGGHVVAPDLRGHGRSPWAGPSDTYHFAEYVADLDALVRELGGRVRLVGHSLGGAVTSIYAGARPERVERLAVIDGLGLPDGKDEGRWRMIQFLDGLQSSRPPKVMPDIEAAAARLRGFHPYLDAAHALSLARRGTRPIPGGVAWSHDPRHQLRSPVPYRADNHVLFLREIRCPVLSIHPEGSLFAPEDVARVESSIPRLRVATLPGVGHMAALQAPDDLSAILKAFFDETCS